MDKKSLELEIKLIAQKASYEIKTFATDVKNAATQAKGFSGNTKNLAESVKNIQQEAKRAATSLNLFGGSASELRNVVAKVKNVILDLTDKGLKPESEEIQKLVSQYKSLDEQLSKTEKKQSGFLGSIEKLKREIGSLASIAAAVKTDKMMVGLASGALEASNSFQKAKDDFGIMLNDMEAGAGFFNELQEFNFWTPFDIEQTSQAAKVLLSAKVPLQDITNYLVRFGDIAQGDSQRFQSFINAFSKASAKGKADMEVLNVYIDQGVQVLDALANQLGVTTAQVVDMSSKGEISFETFNRALESMASEGGQYYGTLSTAAMRLDAVQAGLDESTKALKASFGQMLAPAVSKVLTAITNLTDAVNSSPIAKGILATALVTITSLVNTFALKSLVSLIAKLWLSVAAQTALNTAISAANPFILGLTAVLGVASFALAHHASEQQKAAKATEEHALELKKLKEELSNVDFMDGMSSGEAQRIVDSYKSIIIPAAQEAVKQAEEKLTSIPRILVKTKTLAGSGETFLKKIDNPEYTQAQKELERANVVLEAAVSRQKNAESKLAQIIATEKKAIATFGTEWQDKLLSDTAKIDEQEAESLAKLAKKAKESFGERYQSEAAYLAEVAALRTYYNRKRSEEEAKYRQEVDKWLSSGTDLSVRLSAVESRMNSDVAKLKEAAKKAHVTQEEYIKAEASLRAKYAKEARALVMSEHDTRMKNIKEEAEYRAALARNKLDSGSGTIEDVSSYVGNKMYAQVAGTDLGELMSSFTSASSSVVSAAKSASGLARSAASASSALGSMGGPIASIVLALVQALMKLENVQKVFGMFGTIVNRVVEIIGPIVNSILEPIAEYLEALGDVIGQFLKAWLTIIKIWLMFTKWYWIFKILVAVCEAVANAFTWFYEKVITPVGNAIIDVINTVIDIINTIPGLNIKKFDRIGDNADKFSVVLQYLTKVIEEEIAKQKYLIEKKYQRLIDAVDDLLNSKLTALQSRYELGLISRAEYESQAQVAAATADSEKYDLQKEQDAKISDLEADAIRRHKEEIWAVWNWMNNAVHFDVGATEIDKDQRAIVHKGETIIPRTFAEGIRSGELTLSGKNSSSLKDKSPIVVNLTVEGSVVSESRLIDSVYKGIAAGIQQRKYSPFPGAAV